MTAPIRHITLDVPIAPTWLMLEVRSGCEVMTREALKKWGVESFFPGRLVQRHRFGRTWTIERAEVTGYVFAKFDRVPLADNMRERLKGFYGFVTCNGCIVTVPRPIIQRLHGLSVEAQELEAARLEMLRVKEGDTAKFLTGALAGHTVEVKTIGNVVTVLLNGRAIKTDLASLERVDVPDLLR
jgi:transcription antitermination factor NusG